MIRRRSLPLPLQSLKGRPMGYGHCVDGRVVGVYRDFLVIAQPDEHSSEVLTYEWIDMASARWDQPSGKLSISFVDSSVPTLVLELQRGQSEDIAPLIHERVDSSFFWRQRQELPSGANAVFMIRSGKKSRLSIQVLYDAAPSGADKDFIESMYERMRDLANISE